jgi:hypothetical protein
LEFDAILLWFCSMAGTIVPETDTLQKVARFLWTVPNTTLGVVVVLVGFSRASLRVVDGVLEAHGPVLAWLLKTLVPLSGGAAALTLGHVVIGVDAQSLEVTRAHERVHVRQYERWGPFFVPAYLIASATAALRGRHFYFDNIFEIEACRGETSQAGEARL